MSITGITVWQKTLPLKEPYWLSGGRLKFEALDSTFVRIACSDGSYGWGEGCPWGNTYLPAFGGGTRAALELLAPVLLGEEPGDIDRLNRAMDQALPGHLYAKSPLDMALWDLAGKRAGQPLFALFGGRETDAIDINSSISTGAPDEMVTLVERAREKGYAVHSCKVGGTNPDIDIARIEAVEKARLTTESITFDVNRAWTPAVAIEVMNSVSARGWFEQPCETYSECLQVARNTDQLIMLDECLHTFEDHLVAWKDGACQGAKIKPNRLGGLTRSRLARDFGVNVGWRMHVEDVGGTVLADTAAMHLAISTPDVNRLGSWLCQPHLVDDYAHGKGARNSDGKIQLEDTPGIGVEPPESFLGEPVKVYGS